MRKNKILQIPIGPDINKSNAFEQTFQELKSKLQANLKYKYVDYYKFQNSEYKGQMMEASG